MDAMVIKMQGTCKVQTLEAALQLDTNGNGMYQGLPIEVRRVAGGGDGSQ